MSRTAFVPPPADAPPTPSGPDQGADSAEPGGPLRPPVRAARLPRWAPIPLAAVLLALAVAGWRTAVVRERAVLDRQVADHARILGVHLGSLIGSGLLALEGGAERWAGASEQERRTDALILIARRAGFEHVGEVDPAGEVRWHVAAGPHPGGLLPEAARRPLTAALERAGDTDETTIGSPFPLAAGLYGFVVVVPLRSAGGERAAAGSLYGLVSVNGLLGDFFSAHTGLGLGAALDAGGAPITASGAEREPTGGVHEVVVRVRDARWRLRLWPMPKLAERASSGVPALVLIAGVAVAALLTLSAHLAQLALSRADRLEAANRVLGDEVARRRRAERKVRDLNLALSDRVIRLEAANRELESFSYSVSHDLRAPLRHLTGFAELLGEEAADRLGERGRRHLRIVREAAERMGRLIDELLAFSRTGMAELNARPVDLGALVGEVIETLRPAVDGRPVEWRIGALPEVRADPILLRTVMQNLLDNALKFTRGRSPARIEVGAEASNGRRAIWVRDNGVGFDPRHADKLFGIFQRLHREDEFEGHGVGLANVQRIIHRHGGTVRAEGEPGAGATFTFTLPAA